MRERIVLPRLQDLIDDVLEIMRRLEQDEEWECLVLDDSDAFKHLFMDAREKRYLGGASTGMELLLLGAPLRNQNQPLALGASGRAIFANDHGR